MKQSIVLILVSSLLIEAVGCTSLEVSQSARGNKYRYSYKLVEPAPASGPLQYRDENIIVQFRFDDAAINFQLQNLSEDDMRINWEKASIGINGEFQSVRNRQTLYTQTVLPKMGPIIPSYGYVVDLVMPAKSMEAANGSFVERELFQTVDRNSAVIAASIERNVRSTVELVLPIAMKKEEKVYKFRFAVASVRQIPWASVRPPNRIAPGTQRKKPGLTSGELWTAAGITVGIVAAVILIIANTKQPNSGTY